MATAERVSIQQLFNEQLLFQVPTYQRGYRWESSHIIKLLEDFIKFKDIKSSNGEDNTKYCLQPIMVKKATDNENINILIDGQQRLTSLWIMQGLYHALCGGRNKTEGNWPWRNISIEFVGKPYYEEIFRSVKDIFCDSSIKNDEDLEAAIKKLQNDHFPHGQKVDIDHFFANILALLRFNINGVEIADLLKSIFGPVTSGKNVAERIEAIWYELGNENEIDAFTNINANKIPLTESELIKAHFIYNFSHNDTVDMDGQSFGDEWEKIEHKLSNEDYWYFLNADKSSDSGTNIDLLFRIWCNSKGIQINNKKTDSVENKSDYPMFDAIEKYIKENNGAQTAKEIWEDVIEIEGFLYDWYNDFFYYHAIGLLILISDHQKTDAASILNELCCEYQNEQKCYTKETFKKTVIEKIKKAFERCARLDDLFNSLNDLRYDVSADKDKIRNILITYNIAAIINAKCEYERFPYKQFLKVDSDIEHLNPQIRTDEVEKERIPMLLKTYLPDNELTQRTDNNFSSEEQQRIIAELGEKEHIYSTHTLGNLVLLDQSVNRSNEYKDKKFIDKTQIIIDILRTGHQKSASKGMISKYIPVGTKWVFLKAFSHPLNSLATNKSTIDDNGHWCGNEDYLNDINQNISALFEIESEENINEL